MSPETVIKLFQQSNLNTISHEEYYFITRNLIITEPANHVPIEGYTWRSNFDTIHELGLFEDIAFRTSKDIYLVTNHMTVMLDNDLIGSRSKYLQNKMISARKAAKEGHAADVLSENFLSVVIYSRLRRIGESQNTNIYKLLNSTFAGRGEKSLRGIDLGGDRGYGSYFLGKLLAYYGISSAFIMPQHLNKSYLFIAKSLVANGSSKNEDEDIEEEKCNEKTTMNETLN